MTTRTNPAHRLFQVLFEARQPMHSQKAVMNVWADVFEIDLDEPSGMRVLISRLYGVHALVNDVQSKVLNKNVNHNLYLRHFSKIEHAIKIDQMGASWSHYSAQLNDAVMDSIEHCSELLAVDFSEEDISQQISEFKGKVDALSEEVLASKIEKEIKNFILDELEIIRRGIFEYRLRGASGLREAVASSIGTIIVNHEVVSSEDNGGYFNKLKYNFGS